MPRGLRHELVASDVVVPEVEAIVLPLGNRLIDVRGLLVTHRLAVRSEHGECTCFWRSDYWW